MSEEDPANDNNSAEIVEGFEKDGVPDVSLSVKKGQSSDKEGPINSEHSENNEGDFEEDVQEEVESIMESKEDPSRSN